MDLCILFNEFYWSSLDSGWTVVRRTINKDLGYREMNVYFVYIFDIEKLICLLILSFLENYLSPEFLQYLFFFDSLATFYFT